MFYVKINIIFH